MKYFFLKTNGMTLYRQLDPERGTLRQSVCRQLSLDFSLCPELSSTLVFFSGVQSTSLHCLRKQTLRGSCKSCPPRLGLAPRGFRQAAYRLIPIPWECPEGV